jgi:hypothetical protein
MFGTRGVAQSMCAANIRSSLRVFASVVGEAVSDPDCSTDACPCEAPFQCVDGRCSCDARVSCPVDACDALPDGCGGAHDCGGCFGTLQCAGMGAVNTCENGSACEAGHVCASLWSDGLVPTSATVWFVPDDFEPGELPILSARIETNAFAIPTLKPNSASEYAVDFDLTALNTGALGNTRLAIVLAEHDLAATPARSGDRWHLFPRTLALGPGWVVNIESDGSMLLPITPDVPSTPGHDAEGVVACGGTSCYGLPCCDGQCTWELCIGARTECDGPEDCARGLSCCWDGSTGVCGSDCNAEACHSDGQCTAGTCVSHPIADLGTCSG